MRKRLSGSSIFVTGTDTGVGKTFVAAALAAAMSQLGVDVGVMKPVATGCHRRGGGLVSEDAQVLMAAAGCGDTHDEVCPFRYAPPVGPSVASRLAGKPVRFDRLLRVWRLLAARHRFMIVEGIGGLAVPLSGSADVACLAGRLGLPVLIVAANRLGVLSHTLLTAAYARSRGVSVIGAVLNSPPACSRDMSARTNVAELRRQGVPVLASLPRCRPETAAEALAPLARRLLG